MVDWEQVRIDAAINTLNALLSSSVMAFILQYIFRRELSDIAVKHADKLVEELKKRKE